MTLFLIADLIASSSMFPCLLGFWRKSNAYAALTGCFAGLISVIIQGWIITGTLNGGFNQITLPDGLNDNTTLYSFLISLTTSLIWTVGISTIFPCKNSEFFTSLENTPIKTSFDNLMGGGDRESLHVERLSRGSPRLSGIDYIRKSEGDTKL